MDTNVKNAEICLKAFYLKENGTLIKKTGIQNERELNVCKVYTFF